MDAIFQRLLTNNFSEIPGLHVEASIPLSENLVNEILNVTLRGNKRITYTRVRVHPDNKILADVKSPLLPWPLHLKIKLLHSIDFTGSPKLRAFLANNILLSRLGSIFGALPKGMTLYGDQIVMDVETFTPPEHKRFLNLVKSVDIQTEEGKVILRVKLERDAGLSATPNKS